MTWDGQLSGKAVYNGGEGKGGMISTCGRRYSVYHN